MDRLDARIYSSQPLSSLPNLDQLPGVHFTQSHSFPSHAHQPPLHLLPPEQLQDEQTQPPLTVQPIGSQTQVVAPRQVYSDVKFGEQWDMLKPAIRRLYSRYKLPEIVSRMNSNYSFDAR
jgi:hypothetical protein